MFGVLLIYKYLTGADKIILNFLWQTTMKGKSFSMKSSTVSEDLPSSESFDAYGRGRKGKPQPVSKYYPSSVSVDFWEAHFGKYDEVSILHFVEHLIPEIEKEISANFYYNQIMNMIDAINYENRHVCFSEEIFLLTKANR
jgi:hypothetical protein